MLNNSYLIYAYNSLVKEDEEILSVVIPTKNNHHINNYREWLVVVLQ